MAKKKFRSTRNSKSNKTVKKRNTKLSEKSFLNNLENNRVSSKYEYILQKRVNTIKKKGAKKYKVTKYDTISINKFKPNNYYRIYLRRKGTSDKRLLGFGKFYNIPFISSLTGKQHAGYAFKIRTGKPPKGWIRTTKLYKTIQKEIEDVSKESGAEIRANLLPVRKYYHPKYMIFSDEKIKLSQKPKVVGVSVLLQFNYGHQNWLNKRIVFIDMRDEFPRKRPTYKQLYKMTDKIEEIINDSINLNFVSVINGQAEINVVAINGFIPTTFVPKSHVSPFGKSNRSIFK